MANQVRLRLAVLAAAMAVQQGCSSRLADVMPPPTADFPVKPAQAESRAATQHVNVVARYVVLKGPLPEAAGALVFLANEEALVAGSVLLLKGQADAALEELSRLAVGGVKSMPAATVEAGRPAHLKIAQTLRYPVGWKKDPVAESWTPTEIATQDVGVGMRVDSQVLAGGRVQLELDADEIVFAGLVEHVVPNEGTTALPEFLATADTAGRAPLASVNMGPQPSPVYEPVFSRHSVEARVMLAPGETVVLRGEWERAVGASGALVKLLKEEAPPVGETMLVFLTAEVSAATR